MADFSARVSACSFPITKICNGIHQGCSVWGSVKSSGSQTFTHFNEPKCRSRAIKSSSNFMPFFRIFGYKSVVKNAGALDGRQTF